MISKELSETLGFAVKEAKKRRHEYVSVEHVLFALLHDETGIDIIEKCGGDVDNLKLSKTVSRASPKAASMCSNRPSDSRG